MNTSHKKHKNQFIACLPGFGRNNAKQDGEASGASGGESEANVAKAWKLHKVKTMSIFDNIKLTATKMSPLFDNVPQTQNNNDKK
jgi:hypothetical protein